MNSESSSNQEQVGQVDQADQTDQADQADQAPKHTTVSLQDATPLQSVDVIFKMLNKAASAGVYTIDESHALKILITKVANALAVAEAHDEELRSV